MLDKISFRVGQKENVDNLLRLRFRGIGDNLTFLNE